MLSLRPYQEEAVSNIFDHFNNSNEPAIINASVGAGKSLMIAKYLIDCEKNGYEALCITMSASLVIQNCQTYNKQGGNGGVICGSINSYEIDKPIIFATPQTLIKSLAEISSQKKIDIIVIDECHNYNHGSGKTTYEKIINHFKKYSKNGLKVIGLTGTPYRGKGKSIVGEDKFFKKEIIKVGIKSLISEGYLTRPKWGIPLEYLHYSFSEIQPTSTGKFNNKEIDEVLGKSLDTTKKIVSQVLEITKQRKGAFIFCSNVVHAQYVYSLMPKDSTCLITGDLMGKKRESILNKARQGKIKYLVNVNVLTTGVDIPLFDTVCMLRATESLVLYTQCIGRGLRLHEGKEDCLILDYGENLERHGSLGDELINHAVEMLKKKHPDLFRTCQNCNQINPSRARKCNKCRAFIVNKRCERCDNPNDISAKFCRYCNYLFINPDEKLNLSASSENYRLQIIAIAQETLGPARLGYRFNNQLFCLYTNGKNIFAGWIKGLGIDGYEYLYNDIDAEVDTLNDCLNVNKIYKNTIYYNDEQLDKLHLFDPQGMYRTELWTQTVSIIEIKLIKINPSQLRQNTMHTAYIAGKYYTSKWDGNNNSCDIQINYICSRVKIDKKQYEQIEKNKPSKITMKARGRFDFTIDKIIE